MYSCLENNPASRSFLFTVNTLISYFGACHRSLFSVGDVGKPSRCTGAMVLLPRTSCSLLLFITYLVIVPGRARQCHPSSHLIVSLCRTNARMESHFLSFLADCSSHVETACLVYMCTTVSFVLRACVHECTGLGYAPKSDAGCLCCKLLHPHGEPVAARQHYYVVQQCTSPVFME